MPDLQMPFSSFSKKLKELRLRNDLTQEQLARKLDITRRTYIYYETGRKYPSVDLLTRISKFFNVSISFLIDEQNESIADAQAQEDICVNLRAKQLVKEISGLFAGGELSETEKDAVMEALKEAYWVAKKKNKQT